MGDISETRLLVTIGTYLGVAVIIIGLIPYQFLVPDYEGATIEVPEDYWAAISLEKYATTWNYTLDGIDVDFFQFGNYGKQKELGGNTFIFIYAEANGSIGLPIFWVVHVDFWWIFITGQHDMNIVNIGGISRGISLDRDELDADYSADILKYIISCDHTQLDCFFAFDTDLYSTPSEAFDHEALSMLIGITWDQVQTSQSAWDIIAMLLFFQLPEIHWFINAILAIPIWLGIAYLSYILILRTIGAIFGGGA